MKVAIVIDSIARGGAERQALYTARGLTQLGCDTHFFYYTRSPPEYDVSLAGDARVHDVSRAGGRLYGGRTAAWPACKRAGG